MSRGLALAALPLAALCAAPAGAETPAVAGAVAAAYDHYRSDGAEADWDLPIWSRETAGLIARWKTGFTGDEVLELQDFGWLCECQDWVPAGFEVAVLPPGAPAGGRIEVTARITLGLPGDPDNLRDERFVMLEEGGAWKVDDLYSTSFPDGLKAALAAAIAERR